MPTLDDSVESFDALVLELKDLYNVRDDLEDRSLSASFGPMCEHDYILDQLVRVEFRIQQIQDLLQEQLSDKPSLAYFGQPAHPHIPAPFDDIPF